MQKSYIDKIEFTYTDDAFSTYEHDPIVPSIQDPKTVV